MESQTTPGASASDGALSPLETLRRRLHEIAKGRPFITIPEAGCEVLGWSHSATYRAANSGTLPTTRTNGRVRKVSVIQLERFIVGNG